MKVCNDCGEEKELDQFAKSPTCADGHRNYCKACHKQRKDAWRLKNKDHHNLKSREWTAKNPEKRKQICSTHYHKNKETYALYRLWYNRMHKEKRNLHTALRRKRARQATPIWADLELIKDAYIEAAYHGLEVDHIIPLKHPKVCGLHVWDNLQLLTKTENCKKSNSFTV